MQSEGDSLPHVLNNGLSLFLGVTLSSIVVLIESSITLFYFIWSGAAALNYSWPKGKKEEKKNLSFQVAGNTPKGTPSLYQLQRQSPINRADAAAFCQGRKVMSPPKSFRSSRGAPPFKWSQLWEPAIVNPVNLKSYTIPIFNLRDPYARSFHLSWRTYSYPIIYYFTNPVYHDSYSPRLHLSKHNSRLLCSLSLLVRLPAFNPRGDQIRPPSLRRPSRQLQHHRPLRHLRRPYRRRAFSGPIWPSQSNGVPPHFGSHSQWVGWHCADGRGSVCVEILHWNSRSDVRAMPSLDFGVLR
jgi:hypothetical protein